MQRFNLFKLDTLQAQGNMYGQTVLLQNVLDMLQDADG